jgi:hypothetical protein
MGKSATVTRSSYRCLLEEYGVGAGVLGKAHRDADFVFKFDSQR